MKIIYKGKFIDKFKEIESLKNQHFKNYPNLYKEFCIILGQNKLYLDNIEIFCLDKYDLYQEKDNFYQQFNSYCDEHKKVFKDIIKYYSFFKSYNKNKGQWLEDFLKELFSNNTKFFELNKNNSWEDGVIKPYFIKRKVKINNKIYCSFSLFPLKFNAKKKISILLDNNPSTYLKKLYENNLDKLFDFNIDIISNNNKDNSELTTNFNYWLHLILREESNTEKIINTLDFLDIFETSIDMSKKKTDITFKDLKNKSIIILEIKNNEKSLLSKDAVNQAISYGLKEKYFNKEKFKKVRVIYTGNLKEDLLEYVDKANLSLKDNEKFIVELIKFEDFMDELKENYFDDESKKTYRRQTFCLNYDTMVIVNKDKGDSYLGTTYKKYMEFNNNKNYVLFKADFDYNLNPLSFIQKEINKRNNIKRENEKQNISRIASERFEK